MKQPGPVLLFLLPILLHSLRTHAWDPRDQYGNMDQYNGPIEQYGNELLPAAENLQSSEDFDDRMDAVKRMMRVQTRTMKRCAKGRMCPNSGVCCGKRCCRKNWTCRYMSNIKSFYCIP